MKSKRVIALVFGLALSGPASVMAQSTSTYAVGRGKMALREMEPLPDGFSETYYFKLSMSERTNRAFGYSEMSLTSQRDEDGKLYYHYRHETKTRAPNGNRFNTLIEAKLTPQFSPLEINTVKTTLTQFDQEYIRKLTVVVGAKEIVQTRLNNGQFTTKYFDRPQGPFVFATEMLLEHIKFEKFKSFDWHIFDPDRCVTATMRFLVEVQADLSFRIVAATGAPDTTQYYFTLDAEKRLVGWGEVPAAAISKRIDQAELEALMESLDLE